MQQDFRFHFDDADDVRRFLRSFAGPTAQLDERADEFFVFTAHPGEPPFSVDFWLRSWGLRSTRSENYFAFLGMFVDAVTGHFGPVTIEDSSG